MFGPQGGDGYSAPIWDKVSGQIHHAVARAWMPMDIDNYLMTHWPTIGPELAGKINFFVGTADTFFLNDAVQLLQQNVANLASPPADFTFTYGLNQPHGWSPYTTQQLIVIMAEYMAGLAPAGTSTSAWLGHGVQAVQPVRGLVQAPTMGARSPHR